MALRSSFAVFIGISLAMIALAAKAAPDAAPRGVVVKITASKQTATTDNLGHATMTWQPLEDAASLVVPGDKIRYVVTGTNHLPHTIRRLILTQPISRNVVYLAHSAAVVSGGKAVVTASIDGGATFSATPMKSVTDAHGTQILVPAPEADYTTLRWTFAGELPAGSSAAASCEVRVR